MYFPYLRSKQNELAAITEIGFSVLSKGNVLPIIEPLNTDTLGRYVKLVDGNIKFVLIVNPIVGDLKFEEGSNYIEEQIVRGPLANYKNYLIGVILQSAQPLLEVQYFLNTYQNYDKVFIHKNEFNDSTGLNALLKEDNTVKLHLFDISTSLFYQSLFETDAKAILFDGFNKMPSNSDYSTDDPFADVPFIFKKHGYIGFGDYQTIGEGYSVDGFTAITVTLHLTYRHENSIRVAHFKAEPPPGTKEVDLRTDNPGKFLKALDDLITFVKMKNMQSITLGIKDFECHHKNRSFPGLGVAKRMSIKHHIELMGNLLNG